MALGPQFKNTYWTDEQGSTQYSLSSTAVPFAVGRYNFYPKEVGPRARKTFIPTQGMLFSPETGTGAKNDPLVPHERRIQAIKKSLGMNDPDKYAKRAGYSMNSSPRSSKKPLGKRATKKAIDAYTDALDDSDLSTYEMEKHLVTDPVLPVANTNMTRGHISGRTIRLPYEQTYETIEVPETTKTVRTGVKLQPIPNPNLAKQVENVYWDSDQYVQDGVFEIADIATPDGSVYDKTPHYETEDIPDFRAGYGKHKGEGPLQLPPGHHFNVWPGSGANVTDPDIVVKKHEVYDGVKDGGRESLRTFHTRHRIVGHESSHEKVVPAYLTSQRGKDKISESSLVHELGHHFDPNLSDNFNQRDKVNYVKRRGRSVETPGRPDPAQEGVADGFTIAHVRHKDKDRAMHEQGETGKLLHEHGYTTDFSGFANNTSKALYASMAAHTAAYPRIDDIKEIPSRTSLHKQYYPEKAKNVGYIGGIQNDPVERHNANVLLLGHMYDNHEHVRKTLDSLGLSKAGMDAHKFYKDNDPKRYKGPEQTKLPGFE